MKGFYSFKGRCIGSNRCSLSGVIGISYDGKKFLFFTKEGCIEIRSEFVSQIELGDLRWKE